jgi:hypothetical protein
LTIARRFERRGIFAKREPRPEGRLNRKNAIPERRATNLG